MAIPRIPLITPLVKGTWNLITSAANGIVNLPGATARHLDPGTFSIKNFVNAIYLAISFGTGSPHLVVRLLATECNKY